MTGPDRRLVRVAVSIPLLVEIMREGYVSRGVIRNIEGVPSTALYVGSYTEPNAHSAWFVFSDPSFDVVEMGDAIPVRRVSINVSELKPAKG